MSRAWASVVCFSVIAWAGVAVGGDKKAAKLEGIWIATGGISEGKKLPDEVVANIMLTIVIDAGKYSVSAQGKEIESGTFKADPSKKPPTIDVTIKKGKDAGKTQFGVYKLDGDNLTFAIASVDKDRPKTLDAGPDVDVTILKRKK